MKPLIKIKSNGSPKNTKVTWIETGETIPVIGLVFSIRVNQMGIVLLEVPANIVDSDIKCEKYVLHKIENKKEMDRLGLARIN